MVQERAFLDLSGDVALIALFEELPAVMRARVLEPALKEGAKPIKDRVDALTPIQSPPYKGQSPGVRLKTLGTELVKRKRTRGRSKSKPKWVGWRVQFPVRERMGIAADALHYYPAALEYGHGSARPVAMMRRGLLQTRGRANSAIRSHVKTNIDKEVIKLAKKKAAKK
jgi:hypothetical protein